MKSRVDRGLPVVFGKNVKKWRNRRGLTQEEAANRCRVDYKRWQKIEQGRVNVTILLLGGIAAILRVRSDRLLKL
jgi:transcriptional regulator with XRE-family HTH domain